MREEGNQKRGLQDLIEHTKRTGLVVIEIGSYTGESADIFLSSGRVSKIYCVDPWENGYDNTDPASYQVSMNLVENEFDIRTARYSEKVVKIKNTSSNALEHFISNGVTVDLVYIDGNHQAEYVKRDILNYLNLLKPGGFMAGHDWQASWIRTTISEVLQRNPDRIFQDYSWIYKI
jgi:predicted O-methyltransferase YrrM